MLEPGAWQRAREEHIERERKITAIVDELGDIMLQIADQGGR